MHPIIMKFGGTSVSKKARIDVICQTVLANKTNNPIVVVSALSGVTDLLLAFLGEKNNISRINILKKIEEKHQELIESIWQSKKSRKEVMQHVKEKLNELNKLPKQNFRKNIKKSFSDKVVSYGEILSSHVISCALEKKGITSKQVVATDCIVTDDHFGSAEFIVDKTKERIQEKIMPLLKKNIVPVVTGFIGATVSGKTTTFGRGGSDYTASILGYSLSAKEIQIWTDVDGIFTTDPRMVKKVWLIPSISFREASELASFGAKVLHPRTLKPAIAAKIPVRVLNTFNPKSAGTSIIEKSAVKNSITAISFKRRVTLVNVYSLEMLHQKGFLAKIYKIFAKHDISVDLVSSSEVSESIVLDNDDNLEKAVVELSKFASVSVKKDLGMVSLIGEGIVSDTKSIMEIFKVLDKEKILVHMVSLGAIDINVSLVVKSDEVSNAVTALHKNFFKR